MSKQNDQHLKFDGTHAFELCLKNEMPADR